jgi:hypothetical protein
VRSKNSNRYADGVGSTGTTLKESVVRKRYILAYLFFIFSAIHNPAVSANASCKLELDKKTFKVEWTAFKTTAKTPVSGTFKNVQLLGQTSATSLVGLVKKLTVKIDAQSVDTGNPARDQTLTDFFFKRLKSTAIEARIKSLNETNQTLLLELSLNNQTKLVTGKYAKADGGLFKASSEIDIFIFGAKDAFSSLHNKCLDLHKGADGQSKTWNEVGLKFEVVINERCS